MTDARTGSPSAPLGAILAGGDSSRFGQPKALATVGGWTLIERVRDALSQVVPEVVLVTGRPELFDDLFVRSRPDDAPGLGALGGVATALRWARDEGHDGALCVACDLPFLSAAVLRAVVARAGDGVDAVVPESRGRRGVEPLCAWYSVRCLEAIDRLAAEGEQPLTALLDRVRTDRLPLEEVERLGDPEVLFLNVNTMDDLKFAVRLAAGPANG